MNLQLATQYEARLRSRCSASGGSQGTTYSDYTSVVSFTTLAVPCETQPPIKLAVSMLLDAAYSESNALMTDALRSAGLVPTQEPYTAMGFALDVVTALAPSLLNVTGASGVVDWVLVELRDGTTPTTVIERRAGLLLRNGKVVRPDNGSDTLFFCSTAGSYHIAVRHRNHLGSMTGVPRQLGSASTPLFFQEPGFVAWGADPQRGRNGVQLLWSGNSLNDAKVKYTGLENDRDIILNALGGVVPTGTINIYHSGDINLDGVVKYTGPNNDRDLILQTVGGVVPTAVRTEQIP